MKPICLTANDYKRLAPYISNEFIRLNFIGCYTEKYSVVVEQHWFTAAKVYKILEVAKKFLMIAHEYLILQRILKIVFSVTVWRNKVRF